MKFKVGDKVRVKNELIDGKIYEGVYFNETMKSFCGKNFIVRNVVNNSDSIYYILNDGTEHFYSGVMLEPVDTTEKLVIYRNGNKTIAKYYKSDKTFEAKAKCSPEDEYDFKTGAELAMNRVMDEAKEEKKEEVGYSWVKCIGYRQKKEFYFTVGKTYKVFDDGKITNDVGFTYAWHLNKKAVLDYLSGYYIFEEI